MQWMAGASKMKSMPAFGASDLRCIRPRPRVAKSAATSARMRCMPAFSCTTGSCWASAGAASSIKARTQRINEKGRTLSCLFLDRRGLLLVALFRLGLLGLLGLRRACLRRGLQTAAHELLALVALQLLVIGLRGALFPALLLLL